jgi:hypothetical protein
LFPYHEEEMFEFSVSAREILAEMCRKKVEEITEAKLNESRKKEKNEGYVDKMVNIIDHMRHLRVLSSAFEMPDFQINILIDNQCSDAVLERDIFKKELNLFFEECLYKKLSIKSRKIGDIYLKYQHR